MPHPKHIISATPCVHQCMLHQHALFILIQFTMRKADPTHGSDGYLLSARFHSTPAWFPHSYVSALMALHRARTGYLLCFEADHLCAAFDVPFKSMPQLHPPRHPSTHTLPVAMHALNPGCAHAALPWPAHGRCENRYVPMEMSCLLGCWHAFYSGQALL